MWAERILVDSIFLDGHRTPVAVFFRFTERNHRINTEQPPVFQILYILTERDPEDGLYFKYYKCPPEEPHIRLWDIQRIFVLSVDDSNGFNYCLPVG